MNKQHQYEQHIAKCIAWYSLESAITQHYIELYNDYMDKEGNE